MACPISVSKFVGTVSLGLLTGLSYSTSAITIPALQLLPTATTAARSLNEVKRLSRRYALRLSFLANSCFCFAWCLSSPRRRHPYMVWLWAFSALSAHGVDFWFNRHLGFKNWVSAVIRDVSHFSLTEAKKDEDLVVVETEDEVNGETVQREMGRERNLHRVRAWLSGIALSIGIVGLWGDKLYILFHITRSLLSPLRFIPGPFWARFSNLWYFNRLRKGRFEHENIALHQKYGPIVRLGPKHYSISDATSVKKIYGPGSKFAKSAWYDSWKHPAQWTVFSDRDIKRHAETRKRFTSLYSMTSLVHYEPFVDHCADLFSERLNDFAENGKTFDIGYWFQCYAFDVIGNITFGERFGFLDEGRDINGAISALHKVIMHSTLIGVYPEWHPRLFGILSKFKSSGAGGRAYFIKFVQEKLKLRDKVGVESEGRTEDFVEKMMIARAKDPEKVTDYHLFIMGQSNVMAGSDTTAISLSAIMWHLLNYPETLRKLRDELDEFTSQGRCGASPSFKETQEMPYFQAVMKETLRMHAATGLPMWRTVPEGGAEIHGRFMSEGTVVGINTWVAHYDESVFPDARTFRPERWIEAESWPEKLKEMNQMYMPFGLGSRTCLGKHISILEMSKVIPRLVQEFDFVPLRKTWRTENFWFVKPVDFEVRVQRRIQKS
ncbi:unnamed protein product [Penicillium salamii]|uniref:Cytochrome P450 n=1 Tax=Penicillium salamii TaxID=1612424 RepID=A0A9W4IM23_9EURO|nr:unnamed protein product [Penicillium salamii]CAG7979292.1 unnamed protein product [Penicillium salamii]CAG7982541.1 unnamed protein product [Penicillium salamii]CAG8015338.1 unnamed protein product [Penicillium salamii]CAG8055191.1 unnamed protein product [Penicillium salamii]